MLCHEVAHALAHDPADREGGVTTAQREVQAEGAAFVALAALGLDTARASLPYIKGWAGGDGSDEAVRRELAAIDRIARTLLDRLDEHAPSGRCDRPGDAERLGGGDDAPIVRP